MRVKICFIDLFIVGFINFVSDVLLKFRQICKMKEKTFDVQEYRV